MVARIADLSAGLARGYPAPSTFFANRSNFQGLMTVLISDYSSVGAKLPRDMSVKACMAGPPSMRTAVVLPSFV